MVFGVEHFLRSIRQMLHEIEIGDTIVDMIADDSLIPGIFRISQGHLINLLCCAFLMFSMTCLIRRCRREQCTLKRI